MSLFGKKDFHKEALEKNKLGIECLNKNDFTNAEKYFQEAIDLTLDSSNFHPNIITYYHNLGQTIILNQDLDYEKKLNIIRAYESAYNYSVKFMGYESEEYFISFEKLIGILVLYGYKNDSIEILNEIAENGKNNKFLDYSKLLNILKNLSNKINEEEKEKIYNTLESFFEKINENNKDYIIEFYTKFSELYENNGNLEKAIQILNKLLNIIGRDEDVVNKIQKLENTINKSKISKYIYERGKINETKLVASNNIKYKPFEDFKDILEEKYFDKIKLSQGISEKLIIEFSKLTNLELPTSFKNLCLNYNGEDENSFGIFFGMYFLPLEKIFLEWKGFKGVVEDKETHKDLSQYVNILSKGKIKKIYASNKIIPFIGDFSGNFIAIDLNPDKDGKIGQIINYGRDEDDRFVIADSLDEFFEILTEGLKSGLGFIGEGIISFNGEDLFFIDGLKKLVIKGEKSQYSGEIKKIKLETKEKGRQNKESNFFENIINNNLEGIKDNLNGIIDINKVDNLGNTGLHYAVLNENEEMIKFLITKGIDLEIKNSDGKSAIEIALENGYENIINILIDLEFNLNKIKIDGKSLLEIGKNSNNNEIKLLLKDKEDEILNEIYNILKEKVEKVHPNYEEFKITLKSRGYSCFVFYENLKRRFIEDKDNNLLKVLINLLDILEKNRKNHGKILKNIYLSGKNDGTFTVSESEENNYMKK